MDAAVVIPSIRVDPLLERCVAECHRTCPGAEIIAVVDDDTDAERIASTAKVVVSHGLTIGAKRNLGAKCTTAAHLAFIDSDAYPADGWLEHALGILGSAPELGAVGGPNVSPPVESRSERHVGLAHHSFLVDGWWTYRKDPRAHERDVVSLPSCNLVVRRSDYDAIGGMDESLFTAEDLDFCARLVAAGKGIRFSSDVLVFHKNRDLRSFVVQRFTFGVAMVPMWRARRRAPEASYDVVSVVLPLFVVFLGSWPLGTVWRRWRRLWRVGTASYVAVVLAEAIRHSRRPHDVPGAALAIAVGNLAPGLGVLMKALEIAPDLRGVYRNDG